MPVFTKHLILPACALSALLALPTAVHAKDYTSCLSEKLKGISNDAAVKAITDACKAEYPQKNTAPLRVSSNIVTPLSEVTALTPEEVYEGHIGTMYKTTDRVNQEVAAREVIRRKPNAITEDFRFIEAMLLNGVGYSRIHELDNKYRDESPQFDNLVRSMYNTYCGQMKPADELNTFKALIYTLYRNDKRYSENGGNNAHMTTLQQVYTNIYQKGTKQEREKTFDGLKEVFNRLEARERKNVQIVAKALFNNVSHNENVLFKTNQFELMPKYSQNRNLLYLKFLNEFEAETLIVKN